MSAGDIAKGKAKSALCVACHNANGIATIKGYPNLAGQNEDYLKLAIKAYQSGQRTGGNAEIMKGIAKMLSAEDIDNLAAYYANMK